MNDVRRRCVWGLVTALGSAILIGCGADRVTGFRDTGKDIYACEEGVSITMRVIIVGRWSVSGYRLAQQCGSVTEGADRVDPKPVAYPCIAAGRRPSNEQLYRLFYEMPDFRNPDSLIGFSAHVNPEIGDQSDCYILGTNPLILGFPPDVNACRDVKLWLSASPPVEPSTRYIGKYPRDRRQREAHLVGKDELQKSIGSVAVFPRDVMMIDPKTANPRGTVKVIQFREDLTMETLLGVRCNPARLSEYIAEQTEAPVRLVTD